MRIFLCYNEIGLNSKWECKYMKDMSESYLVAALLSVTGGFLDAYTFVSRDGVFVNAPALIGDAMNLNNLAKPPKTIYTPVKAAISK